MYTHSEQKKDGKSQMKKCYGKKMEDKYKQNFYNPFNDQTWVLYVKYSSLILILGKLKFSHTSFDPFSDVL